LSSKDGILLSKMGNDINDINEASLSLSSSGSLSLRLVSKMAPNVSSISIL
jgi:hypothetical protein